MARVSFTTKGGKKVSFNTKGTKKRKKGSTKKRKTTKRKTRKTKSRSGTKKSMAKGGRKKGTSGMTRVKKFLLGIGIGAAVSTVAGLTRVREIESAGPIIDAAVGGGVEAQIGTAIPRLIRIGASRFGLNGGNGSMVDGA